MAKTTAFTFFLFVFIFSCMEINAQSLPEKLDIELSKWNKALNGRDYEKLTEVYAEELQIYGSQQKRGQCLAGKRSYLENHPDFKQEVGEIQEVFSHGDFHRIEFAKMITQGGSKKNYAAFLIYEEYEKGKYKIVQESDWLTEKNLAQKAKGTALPQGDFCLNTSGVYSNRVAVPCSYGDYWKLEIKGDQVVGSGGHYSYYSRMMWSLEMKGTCNKNGELVLEITSTDPLYDPEAGLGIQSTETEKWKYDGQSLRWMGGSQPSFKKLWPQDCD